jgi:hypothetical protein
MPACDSITLFRGKYAFLSMSAFSPLIWDGDWYKSAAAAFHASKLESRTARIPFIKYNCKPWRANQMGSQIREWDMRPNWHAGSPPALGGIASSYQNLSENHVVFRRGSVQHY